MPRPPKWQDRDVSMRTCIIDRTNENGSETPETKKDPQLTCKQPMQLSLLSNLWNMWSLIIRPARAQYEVSRLGPTTFMIGEQTCVRRDTQIKTSRGLLLECSLFRARDEDAARCAPVVVYLHGNSGSRVDSVELAAPLLRCGISLFTYDAGGCGLSDGDYISLGWHESEDLKDVLAELQRGSDTLGPPCGSVALWGRSMGAVTALLYAARNQTDPPVFASPAQVVAMCLDSPFASLRQLVSEHAQSEKFRKVAGFTCSGWVFEAAFAAIRMRVQALANFDMEDVSPLSCAPQCCIPALFVHANSDNFVLPSHSRQLHAVYGAARKEFAEVDGSHNSVRTPIAQQDMLKFVAKALVSPAAQSSPQWRGVPSAPIPPPSLTVESSRSPHNALAFQSVSLGKDHDCEQMLAGVAESTYSRV